jgi:ribosome-associated protein
MSKPSDIRTALEAVVAAAAEKKAEGLIVLDVQGINDVTDYFVICHGQSNRQVQTISNFVERSMVTMKVKPKHIEGYTRGEWILMDYLDFVVHIFTSERRAYYGLERLWADAPRLDLPGTESVEPFTAAESAEIAPKELDGAK